jgi:serine/threonine-protein kinase
MSGLTKPPLLSNGIILNGKWEILEHIATGGKGEVYRARQTNLDRQVVVKTVSIHYLAELGDDEKEVDTEIKRFHREALAMAQVRHPYVVQVYDQDSALIEKVGAQVTIHYVVMEYVPGPDLRSTMPEEGFGSDEQGSRRWLRSYFLPILTGIEPIHELGIVHRDLKPENVLLDGSTPKIMDFGIAGSRFWPQLTRSGHVEGTIMYMAPEQFMDLGETDPRADVYALGKILYEVICGKMVDTRTACPLKCVCLANPDTPFLKGLDLIVKQATAEEREQRTPSVKALREALERLLDEADAAERPLLKSLHRRQVVLLLVILAIIAGTFVASHLYHHFLMIRELSAPSPTSAPQTSELGVHGEQQAGQPLGTGTRSSVSTMVGRDGSTMRLVPGGQVTLPAYLGSAATRLVDVVPFYMDEIEVTNFKYVEFLNQALSRIKVKDGVVQGDGRPWLVLGPLYAGYEPIIYRNGRFELEDAASASYPVVKVTGYGASAYADFYGQRLPTEVEWFHAAASKAGSLDRRSTDRPRSGQRRTDLEKEMEEWLSAYQSAEEIPSAESKPSTGPSQVPHPVLAFEPNAFGIRGLNANVSEWGWRRKLAPTPEGQYVILGGVEGSMLIASTLVPGIAQDPSMAFVDVGFRCVLSAGEGQQ